MYKRQYFNRPTSLRFVVTLTLSLPHPAGVLLATCLAVLASPGGGYIVVRAILDSFITEACAARLKCACFDASVSVNGVGDIATKAKKVCHLSLET